MYISAPIQPRSTKIQQFDLLFALRGQIICVSQHLKNCKLNHEYEDSTRRKYYFDECAEWNRKIAIGYNGKKYGKLLSVRSMFTIIDSLSRSKILETAFKYTSRSKNEWAKTVTLSGSWKFSRSLLTSIKCQRSCKDLRADRALYKSGSDPNFLATLLCIWLILKFRKFSMSEKVLELKHIPYLTPSNSLFEWFLLFSRAPRPIRNFRLTKELLMKTHIYVYENNDRPHISCIVLVSF